MKVLFDLLLKLINQFDGYKTYIGVGVLVIGGAMFLLPFTAPYAMDVIYFGLAILGVGVAHKATKKAITNGTTHEYTNNLKEMVVALITTANTIADVTKERFNLDKFLNVHLDKIIALAPLITAAIRDADKIMQDLKDMTAEDEKDIINILIGLEFPDDKAEELTKAGLKAVFYLAQLGANLR